MLTPSQHDAVDALRYTGLSLQLLGVLLAAYGISTVRREWTPDRPGILGTIRQRASTALHQLELLIAKVSWRTAVKMFRRRPTIIARSAHDSALATDAVLKIEPHFALPAKDADPDVKIAWLMNRVSTLLETAFRLDQELAAERRERIAATAATTTALTQTERSMLDKIADFAGGGLRLQTWGVICLLVGITLATIPDKLASIG